MFLVTGLFTTIKRLFQDVVGFLIPHSLFPCFYVTRCIANRGNAAHSLSLSRLLLYAMFAYFAMFGEGHAATPPGTVITNQAQVDYVDAGFNYSLSTNVDTFTVTSLNMANVVVSASPANVYAGNTLTADISITNTGANTLTSGELILQPPSGTVVTTSGGYPVVVNGNTVTVTLPDIAAGANLNPEIYFALPSDLSSGPVSIPVEYQANSVSIYSSNINVNVNGRTSAQADVLYYESGGAGPASQVPVTQYDSGGGVFVDIPAPLVPGGGGATVTDAPLLLAPAVCSVVARLCFSRLRMATRTRTAASWIQSRSL